MKPERRRYTHFLDELLAEYRQKLLMPKYLQERESTSDDPLPYDTYLEWLEDPNTKRLVFDARQAEQFIGIGNPDEEFQKLIHAPFDQFYCEFTEPISIGASEPGYNDTVSAFYFYRDAGDVSFRSNNEDGKEVVYKLPICQIVFFGRGYRESDGTLTYVDQSFKFGLLAGMAVTPTKSIAVGPDPSEIPERWFPLKDGAYMFCGEMIQNDDGSKWEDRHIGWYESKLVAFGGLLSYVLAYTTAKSVVIVQEPLSRQVRRWYERRGEIPKPWHVVKVEPKFYDEHREQNNEPLYHHRYRYDVIGHFRLGRHKRKDGSFIEQIEWVPPHQRGLMNSLYIPKTYKVEGGKKIAPIIREYFER